MSIEDTLHRIKSELGNLEADALKRIKRAEDARYIEPYRNRLQFEHPCCRCGEKIPEGHNTVMCNPPLLLGSMLTSELITWCDPCWKKHYNRVGQILRQY